MSQKPDIDKSDWAARTRIRRTTYAPIKAMAIQLNIPAEELVDFILCRACGEIPVRVLDGSCFPKSLPLNPKGLKPSNRKSASLVI